MMQSLLKSIFISAFPLFGLYATINGIEHLAQDDFSFHYLGQLISGLTIVTFFAGLFINKRARTKRYLDAYTITIGLGLIIAIIERFSNEGYVSNFIVILLVLGWMFYITWYSTFKNRNKSILKVGTTLPNFELENTQQQKINSSSFLGQPTIYLFYRGNWCPLCMAQIKEIANQYKALEKRHVNMVFISPQPHKYSESLAKKYNLKFHFLTDYKNQVAKQFSILGKNGIPAGFQILGYDNDTVLPTVIITDAKGKIIFANLTDNYRVRPEPETFLKIIDSI